MHPFQRYLSLVLAGALALPAQQAPAPKLAGESSGLQIVVIEGENARNSIRSRTAIAPVVEVRDEAGKPVAGAEVTFHLPAAGPGGAFYNWLQTQTVKTGENGRAAAAGYTPNDQEGRFNIKVTARQGGRTAGIVVAQTNLRGGNEAGAGAGGSKRNWWIAAGIIGAGALAGGIYAATNGNGNGAAGAVTNPVVITASPVTVGGPR